MSAADWGMGDEAPDAGALQARHSGVDMSVAEVYAIVRGERQVTVATPEALIAASRTRRGQVMAKWQAEAMLAAQLSADQPAAGCPKRRGRQARPHPDKAALARVRAEMQKAGITMSEWARANGFTRTTVMDVLLGRRAGHSGEAHRVAIALGLKAGKVVSAKGWKPTAAAGVSA